MQVLLTHSANFIIIIFVLGRAVLRPLPAAPGATAPSAPVNYATATDYRTLAVRRARNTLGERSCAVLSSQERAALWKNSLPPKTFLFQASFPDIIIDPGKLFPTSSGSGNDFITWTL